MDIHVNGMHNISHLLTPYVKGHVIYFTKALIIHVKGHVIKWRLLLLYIPPNLNKWMWRNQKIIPNFYKKWNLHNPLSWIESWYDPREY